ncbi:uncharacterized protein LOC119364216 [Triticum dicoccoides]|uniref:Uncharacterized protein n=1 Tax=Triticum turgidum subsp. durum TaxID=4567 RepID=A0A9R1PQB6_TRITD|nr:uncharacterized protein LOC119364216 [Triticum dicoccoides]VAH47639.1 unnamed protein product [Triticum turgidum subsp. durum]
MPQLDLESLFCVGGGESRSTKVACETIAVGASDVDVANAHEQSRRIIWAWSGRTGAALERDGSTKGGSNPKNAAEETTRNKGPSRAPRRLELEAIVVGVLPAGKMVVQQRRSHVVGRDWRRPAAGARVFASEAVGVEPVSPKVSCFGAVRSESRAPAAREEEEERSGCWASVTSALGGFLCGSDSDNRREGGSGTSESKPAVSGSPTVDVSVLSPPRPVLGLGDVKPIASRRWPDGDGRCLV